MEALQPPPNPFSSTRGFGPFFPSQIMHYIKVESIKIAEGRQRQDFDATALSTLRDSIVTNGLLHPPVVTFSGMDVLLLAGERRLRAIKDAYQLGMKFSYGGVPVPEGQVPVNTIHELTPLQRAEIEYEENVQREDLSWAERAKATTLLMSLRQLQAEASGAAIPTIADIAKEVRGSDLGINHTATRNEILITPYLDDPEVAAAKTLRDAVRVVQQKEQKTKNLKAAELLRPQLLASSHTLHLGNSLDIMRTLPREQFDVILTDPPYGMGADEFGDSGQSTMGSHFYDDSFDNWLRIIEVFAVESFALTKPDAHAYVFCDLDNFHHLKLQMAKTGWRVFRTPIIWHKPANFRAPWPDQGPQRKYELILYAVKGGKKVKSLAPDIITCNTDENLGHPAQKPVALLLELLNRSCNPGEKVLDPFCGTGSIFPAAQSAKCIATGIELDPAAHGIAATRIANLLEGETK